MQHDHPLSPRAVERPDRAPITSTRSDRVRRIAALSGRSARRRTGSVRVEGPQAVRSLLAERPDLALEVHLTERAAAEHPELPGLARAAGVRAGCVADEVLRAMVPGDDGGMSTPQGAVALARLPQDDGIAALERALGEHRDGPTTIAVLHEVRDPGNAGTIIRTADAAGADLVVLTAGSTDAWAPKAIRASAGSVFHLPVISAIPGADLVPALRAGGVSVLATSGRAPQDVFTVELPARLAWVLGNEAHGLDPEMLAAADASVRIPLAGRAESLNVQAAATVCLFETLRRRSAAR